MAHASENFPESTAESASGSAHASRHAIFVPSLTAWTSIECISDFSIVGLVIVCGSNGTTATDADFQYEAVGSGAPIMGTDATCNGLTATLSVAASVALELDDMRQTNAAAITKNTTPAKPCSGIISFLFELVVSVISNS
jgi:hypothetical protein